MSSEANSSSGEATGAGAFQVVSCLGLGRQAETYRVRDPKGGPDFVRKVFSAEVSGQNPDIVDGSFNRWAALDHPHLARVLDFGWEEGKVYLHSEWIEGAPLLKALTGAPLERIWRVFAQILVGLDALYRENIPHLDLKPQNVLVGNDAEGALRVGLVDYGLTSLLNPPEIKEVAPLGTPPYTAPEFATQRVPSVQADLYSVGVLLFSALARRSPFEGADPAAILQAQLQKEAPPLKSLVGGAPPALSDFLQKLLARDPAQRPESPLQALRLLQEAAGPAFPQDAAAFPPFSDFAISLRGSEAVHLFRRIGMAGGRWVIGGLSGSGKDFVARAIERIFWLNRMPVWHLSGRNLSLVQGEPSLNPANPTWLLVSEADHGAVEGWLRGRPYERVIAVAQDLSWARTSNGWQRYILNPIDLAALTRAWQESFGAADAKLIQALHRRFKGEPAAVVRGARAMAAQGLIVPSGATWKADAAKIQGAAAGANAAMLGNPLVALPEPGRKLYRYLAFAGVPLSAQALAAWSGFDPATTSAALHRLCAETWLRRSLRGGHEYFEVDGAPLSAAAAGLNEDRALPLLRSLAELGWTAPALRALQNSFAESRQPATRAFRGILQSRGGLHAEALLSLDADLLASLPPEWKGPAYEALGASLLAAGKNKEAEAALRQAFPLYKAAQDAAGQARVYALMAEVVERGGEVGKALQLHQQALNLAASAPEKERLQGKIETAIAELYARATDFDSAENRFQTALGLLEGVGRGDDLAEAYADYAQLCLLQGDPDRAELFCNEALAWALFYRLPALQAKIYRAWAKVHAAREDAAFAIGRYGEAIETLTRSGDRLALGEVLVERSEYLDKYRDSVSAEKDARRAWDLAQREKIEALRGPAALALGRVLSRELAKHAEARKFLAIAGGALTGTSRHWECEYLLGEADRMRGRAPQALRHFQSALRALDKRLSAMNPESPEARELSLRKREVEMSAGAVS
ncbi:MAG TPA: tetratricopeptide repeat protein [bacterium]|nr:tetratricopeptide repeat protein [bacterium]